MKIARDTGNGRARLFDLLVEPISENPDIRREGKVFIADAPWVLASFGQIVLRRGWWTFECEGEGDVAGVELRLVSPEDALIAFSLRRATKGRALFHTDKTFDVSLLASPWPGRVEFTMLRLRRLTAVETARLTGEMFVRLTKSRSPLSKLLHVVSRVITGRSLRIQHPIVQKVKPARFEIPVGKIGTMRTIIQGGLTVVLREDEKLHPRAVEIVANIFGRSPKLQAVYADLREGEQIRPKPEWDADLADFANYVDSPVFFRGEVEASAAWSSLIEMSAKVGAIGRIALPLAFRHTVIAKQITRPPIPHLLSSPLVSVVIPTKIRIDLLERCLEGLAERTHYPALEVVIVNGSTDHERIGEVIARASAKLRLRRVDDFGPFNFSRLINLGVRNSEGEVVLLLNDDVEAIEVGWLHRMVESVMKEGVGCVGARLIYPDGTIQHAGVMLGLSGVCGHLWKGLSMDAAALLPQVVLPSQRMAVTGACLAVRRELFDRVGGLDELRFPVAFNDVDFCLRINALGFRTIYRGDATLIHHESQSRGQDDATIERRKRLAGETENFLVRWRSLCLDDPFGSPAFDPVLESGIIHPSLLE